MTNASLQQRVSALLAVEHLDADHFARALGAPLSKGDENPHWTFFEFKPQEPFAEGELRTSKDGKAALLILRLPADSQISIDDLSLSQWGELRGLDLNPRVPPEGADAYLFEVHGVQVSYQFTHRTRRLRQIALEWHGQAAD